MQLHFFGAAQTVTGSQHVLEVNGHKIMLDCGLYQGRRKESVQRNRTFHFDLGTLDAMLLSHGHIDHSGNLPNLVKNGYRGPIYAQRASSHLTRIMLEDSAHIQEADAEHLNRRQARRGGPQVEALYTARDAAQANSQFVERDYDQGFEVVPGVRATFVEAGHILGSTAIVLDIDERGRRQRLWFSGDIGRAELPIIRSPKLPGEADGLLMECTYGDRNHPSPAQAYEQLHAIVSDTLGRGGKVIIPAFSVGRTQAIVYALHQMIDRGQLPRLPVFVDSPLATDVTDVFRAHRDEFDEETREFLRQDPHGTAFGFDLLRYTRNVEESKAINGMAGPLIVIAGSGMVESGRVLHHLKHTIQDSRNAVMLTAWMAPHTLGRRLLEGQSPVRIYGETYEVRAEVVAIPGLSAHAGQDFLVEYARAVRQRAQRIVLVHGEAGPAAALTAQLRQHGFDDVRYPAMGDEMDL